MVLKGLEIQGFKSFPDKTKISFDHGITAVVGPNGSGKSNISDAIRWVLGETSSKQLRGSGKMEDVIFGGTQLRSAMGFASVQLTLDNSDHRLDMESEEVVIGRKYYRSGESEYSVNGQNVRLKDVYEMFLDTGLGRDGYSIIGQGRIAEIVGSKSAERREIFEEASGIAKYRYRKNEAERKLSSAEENLVRLRDILGELESRVGPLERDSKKAQQFLELSAQKKELEVTLWVDTVRRAKESVRAQQRKMELAQGDYDRDTENMQRVEEEMENIRLEGERLVVEMEAANGEILRATEEISGCDAQIAVLKNDIAHNQAAIEEIRREMEEAGRSGGELDAQIALHTAAIEECLKSMEEHSAKIARLEQLLDDITQKSEATGERRGALTAALAQMTQRMTQLRVDAAFADSTAQSSEARLAAAREEASAAGEKCFQLTEELGDTVQLWNGVCGQMTRLENIKSGLQLKAESRAAALKKAEEEAAELVKAADAARQRVQMLKDLERSMDGYQSSVKKVIQAADTHRLRGIVGTVASVLSVQPGFEVAVETALGFALQNIVVQDETAAKAAMAMLKEERAGRATFLPLDTVKGARLDAKLSGSARVAAELVEYDPKYQNIVTNLLGRIVIVDDINEASYIAKQNGYRFRLVTKDGQVINAGGSFTGGSVARSAGMFSRKQEIEELKEKIARLEEKRRAASAAADKVRAEYDALAAELSATDSELITLGGDKIRAEMEKNRLEAAASQQKAASDLAQAECGELARAIEENKRKKREAEEETARLTEEGKKLEEELTHIDGSDGSFLETRTRLAGELGELKLAQLSAEKDADMHRQSITALQSRTGEAAARRAAQEENIRRLENLSAENEEKAAALEAKKAAGRTRIAEIEKGIADTREARLDKEKVINRKKEESRALAAHREEMGRELARLAERKTTLETEYDQTIAKLWEEYELTLGDAEALCVEFESTSDLRRRVGEIRAKIKALGNVNVGAIEEFKEVNERYTFMKAQVSDVEKAKQELERLIGELSAEMRELFADNFGRINQNFGRIFTELFGGGTARLTLSDPEDLLGSGIEIEVSPPGKIIKNLSALSGGEQALVAISIYFAILAVNPAPFCILDEIEAALDDVNVTRYAQYLRRITGETQFIVITHRRGTMEEADVLYGVTMQEDGVSKLLRLDANQVDVHMVS